MYLLLIDDEPAIRLLLGEWFAQQEHEFDSAEDGESGLALASENDYDAIILDINMPGIDGMEVLRQLRARGDETSVMMLTSRHDEEDIIEALRAGADSYMTKPFSPPELEARVQALTRRSESTGQIQLSHGDIEMDRVERSARRGEKSLRLTKIEFDMLALLVSNADDVVSREQILSEVWGLDNDPGTGLVHVHMSHLREKLRIADRPDPIHTVRGVGYRMAPTAG